MKILKLISVVCLLILVVSCSSTSNLTISTVNPPVIHTPVSATKIGIINRTISQNKTDNLFNDLEEIFSGEFILDDQKATREIINSFGESITDRTKFMNAKIIDYDDSELALTNFPKQIAWDEIRELCKKNNVDIIVELNFLDTDSEIDYRTENREVEVPLLGTKNVKNHIAQLRTDLIAGWRVYDPETSVIADEFRVRSDFLMTGEAINPLLALRDILKQREMVLRECQILGTEYANRFVPQRLRVRRRYFVKGTDNFKIAERYAQSDDWDSAAQLWKKETKNPDLKIRGRAYYNMAIISEIRGELKQAEEWAKKSYVECENDLALDYLNIIQNRISNENYMKANY